MLIRSKYTRFLLLMLATGFGTLQFAAPVQAAESMLHFKAVEHYLGARSVQSDVYLSHSFMRIDGNNTSTIFDAKKNHLMVYNHQQKSYTKIDKKVVKKLQKHAKDQAKKSGDKKLDASLYQFELQPERMQIGQYKAQRGLMTYDGKRTSEVYLLPYSELGISTKDVKALVSINRLFGQMSQNYPSESAAFGAQSIAGAAGAAGLDMDKYAIIRAMHFDKNGRLTKVVESKPDASQTYDASLFQIDATGYRYIPIE